MITHGALWRVVGLPAVLISILAPSMLSQVLAGSTDGPFSSTSLSSMQSKPGSKEDLTIGSWYFLGPYSDGDDARKPGGGDRANGLDKDYLALSGRPEASTDQISLTTSCKPNLNCTRYTSDGPIVNLLKLFPGRPHCVLYAATILTSSADGFVGLQYDISFGAKIWINGQQVDEYRADIRHPVAMYTHFVPLHVKKGENVLLVKTNQEGFGPFFEPWALATSLMSIERMWDFVVSTQDGYLLANRLLKSGDPIRIPLLNSPMMLDRSLPTTVSVTREEAVVSTTTIAHDGDGVIAIPKLDSGYYKVRLSNGTHSIDDAFYIGAITTVHDNLAVAQGRTSETSDEFLQRGAIIKRFDILTSPQYRMPNDANWQKKLMMVIDDAEASLGDQSRTAWYLRPGQHLRELIASTDNSSQNYLLDIPEKSAEKRGLVIIAPYAVSKQRPFLESSFISYSTVLEQVRQAANQSNLAVAIIGAREASGGSSLDEADALDVVKDILGHYSIDPKRIYLYGVCEGGRNALLLAEHHLGVFAAVGAWGPTLAASRDGSDDPVMLAKDIANTPLVLYKGDLDNELPNSALLAFGRILKSLGNHDVTIQIVPNAMHDPIRMESIIFPLLARFTNDKAAGSAIAAVQTDDVPH